MDEPGKLREEGNEHFKAGRWELALSCYTRALKLCNDQAPDGAEARAVLHRNRAAVHLKCCDFRAAEADASKALELVPNDAKSLFRRCQAREKLDMAFDAFNDAKLALHYEPNNRAILEQLQKLAVVVQEKQKAAITTDNKVNQMFNISFDATADAEKRIQAMNNLMVLAREQAGANLIIDRGGVEKLVDVLLGERTDEELVLAAQRVLDELAREETRANNILEKLTVERAVNFLNRSNQQRVAEAASLFIQRCFSALANMEPKEHRKPDLALVEKNKVILVRLLFELKRLLIDPTVGAVARNCAIDLLLKNLIHMDNGLPRGWSWEFISNDGLERLMTVACSIPQHAKLPVNNDTREHLAICMARLYDDMVFDKHRAIYREVVEKFVNAKLENLTNDVKLELCALTTTLLLGPFDVGFPVINSKGITNVLLEMAASDVVLNQSVAVEALVQTASKREQCTFLINQGLPVLRKLYESKNDNVKARALVGLCKVASSSGTDVSLKPVEEGVTLKLANACKKMLLTGSRDVDVRRWAADGLAYLTLDADVKEWLVEDPALIRALVELAKQAGQLCVYGVASVFTNLTNSYVKPKADPEMVKLAQFAKHHVPEEHPKDSEEFVKRRIEVLVKEGAVSACVAISNTQSLQCKELLSRALLSFSEDKNHRGIVVQEGGAKLLMKLVTDNTEGGQTLAAQALAKIGVTINPEIAFPGQRAYEVVRPLVGLLHHEKSGVQNYEALLALTNLASVSDSVRRRIFKEKCLPLIEDYWFMQEHEDLRDAAAELLLNLLHLPEVVDHTLRPGTDRLKLWLLYAGEESLRLARAATGGLALLTAKPEAGKRLLDETKSWAEIFKEVCMRDDVTIQHRGIMALANMMESDYDIAAKITQTDILEVLVVLSKLDDPNRKLVVEECKRAISAAEKWKLIKPTERELHEREKKVSTLPNI